MSIEEIVDDQDGTEITDRLNLATIERIVRLEPIEGKDRIELAVYQGYRGVVEKGIHQVGDLVLVVKYETVVPEIALFEWLRPFKFRVKSKSFNTANGKIYSQTIAMPLREVEAQLLVTCPEKTMNPLLEGDDLTTALGVRKYIPKLQNATGTQFGDMKPKGTFPTHLVSITDETNVQGAVKVLDELWGKPYTITLKCEGSSFTSLTLPQDDVFTVCSRKNMLHDCENNSFWYAARKYDLAKKMSLYKNLALQGELCGAMPDGSHKIQSNVMGLPDIELYLFNLIYIETRRRMHFKAQLDFCKMIGVPHVPVFEVGDRFNYTMDQLLDMVQKVRYPFGNKQIIEGFVIRPQEDTYSERLKDSLSVKVKNPAYDFSALCSQLKG